MSHNKHGFEVLNMTLLKIVIYFPHPVMEFNDRPINNKNICHLRVKWRDCKFKLFT